MKTIASVIVLLVAIHLLGVAAGFVWLSATNRLDRDRFDRVVDVFRLTVDQEAALEAERERNEAEALAIQQQLIRMEDVADGPQSLEDRLARKLEGDDFAMHRLARMQQESGAIEQRLAQDRAFVEGELERLAQERQAFEAEKERYATQMQDEDFRRAVQTLEQLKGRQAKEMLQVLLDRDQQQLVVDYLAAMNLRKSAGILKEFKGTEEAVQAMDIVEALRERGIQVAQPAPAQLAGANP
ncbi:MAG: hypothetical protein AAGH92_11740 [Planctomycetota bacterium]